MRCVLALVVLVQLAAACEATDRSLYAAIERVRTAIESVRFVAYTPTDLKIVAGRVRSASEQQIRKDLGILRRDFQGLVMYSCADGLEAVPAVAQDLDFKALILGIWDPQSEREIANAVRLAQAYPRRVIGVAVGNETLLAERNDWATLRRSIQRLHAALPDVAITTSEPFYFYLDEEPPDFLSVQDFLLPSIHPLYESWFIQATTERAVDFVVRVAARLSLKTGKPLLIKETGLPSGPAGQGFTPARQTEFWVKLSQRLPPMAGPGLVYFEAFDHAWKAENVEPRFGSRPEEAFWGLYNEAGKPKPVMQALRRIWDMQADSQAGLPAP